MKRYRELVAQKSAERLQEQSKNNINEDTSITSFPSSPSSTVTSSDGSSVGSMTSIHELEDEIQTEYDEKDDFYGHAKNSRKSRQMNACKDDLTNELVQEATKITNILKETIREKQIQKQQGAGLKVSSSTSSTPMKTPGKNKTPSKFKVFEDRSNHDSRSNVGNSSSALKSRTKRSALQPKSTNTSQPLSDKKKQKSLLKKSGSGGTFQKSQVAQDSSPALEKRNSATTTTATKTKSPQANLSSSTPRQPPSSLKKNPRLTSTEKKEKHETQKNHDVNEVEVERSKRQSSTKVHNNNQVELEGIQKAPVGVKSPNMIFHDGIVVSPIEKMAVQTHNPDENNRTNHDELEKEEGELLSIGSPNMSTCNISDKGTNVELHEEHLYEEFGNHHNHEESVVTNEEGDDDENTLTSSLNTPTSSVQTFSIGGRSYSFDVSANALRSMFTEPVRRVENESTVGNHMFNDESMTGESISQDMSMRTSNVLNDSVSPTSKILATSKLDGDGGGISRSSAASLIERNKTLIKEVRFADQTCVELSERNAAIQRDVKRMENQIGEMKGENQSLHEVIVGSQQKCAKLEENKESLTKQLDEQRGYYEAQMRVLQQALKEAKEQNVTMAGKVEESNALMQSTEKDLVSTQAKYEALQESHDEAKEKISTLMTRLATSQSTAEVSAASAAQSYRAFCDQMEKKLERLERVSEERLSMYNREKNERIQVENDHSNMIRKCAELEKLIENWEMSNNLVSKEATPNKSALRGESTPNKEHTKTPTSSVLARTLEAELQRGHDATERILEAEMIISVTQSELQESTKQLNAAKLEIERLKTRVNELTEERMQQVGSVGEQSEPSVQIEDIRAYTSSCDNSSLETMSTDELVGKVLSQKLTHARTECEDYKRELENILNEIRRLQGESFNSSTNSHDGSNEQTVSGLLHAVRELAQVCAKQADEINCLKSKSEDRKRQIKELDVILEEKDIKVSDQNKTIESLKLKL